MPQTVDELIELFQVREIGENAYLGPAAAAGVAVDALGQRVFGGQVLAQALMAAYQTIDFNRYAHSLTAYFLRMGVPGVPIEYQVGIVRDGGTFSHRRVSGHQRGRVIFDMDCSFHELEPGLNHADQAPADVPPPGDCPPLAQVLGNRSRRSIAEWEREFGVLDVRFASDTSAVTGGRKSDARMTVWVRAESMLPADPRVHQAFLAYASDLTILSVSTVPHPVLFAGPGMQVASINHTMWFHRFARADLWLLYDQVSPSASSGLGFSFGRLFSGEELIASCAQEGLIRLVDPDALAQAQ
ncbi:MAG: acyl-CoA thioesterase II [Propionibacteriaceae bacterium]|nr:acyl-CoA thioesterase II [Propionibacteriaceae bacterium]